MPQKRTLTVTDPVFAEFNRLKIRIAVDSDNRVPAVSDLVNALLVIGNRHYSDLQFALGREGDSE